MNYYNNTATRQALSGWRAARNALKSGWYWARRQSGGLLAAADLGRHLFSTFPVETSRMVPFIPLDMKMPNGLATLAAVLTAAGQQRRQ
jgi:hypothetical protein